MTGPLLAVALLVAGAAIMLGFLATPAKAIAALGGPDSFGYVWENTTYNFTNVAGLGTALDLADDSSALVAFPAGFAFNFYGTSYSGSSLRVADDGLLSFAAIPPGTTATPSPMGTAGSPDLVIAPFWTDLKPDCVHPLTGRLYTHTLGAAPNRIFVVQYDDIPTAAAGGLCLRFHTFQVKLLEGTDIMEFHYQNVSTRTDVGGVQLACQAASIGVEQGAVGLSMFHLSTACSGGNLGMRDRAFRVYVNDPPVATNQLVTMLQGTTANFTLNVVDPDGNNLTFSFDTTSLVGGPLALPTGAAPDMSYTPPVSFFGTTFFDYQAADPWWAAFGNATARVTIVVVEANGAPTALPPALPTFTEDLLSSGFALDGVDPNGDPLTVVITAVPTKATLEAPGPLVVGSTFPAGTSVRLRPLAHANGADAFGFLVRDTSGAPSLPLTAPLTIQARNDAPVVSALAASIPEDAPAPLAASAWLASVAPGPAGAADEASQTVTFTVVGAGPAGAFSTLPTVQPDRTIVLPLTPHWNGAATLDLTACDDGQSQFAGTSWSPDPRCIAFTVALQVTAVNDPPTFDAASDVLVRTEGGPLGHVLPGWAHSPHPGGGLDESGQGVTYAVATARVAGPTQPLLADLPTVDAATGDLVLQIAHADAYGTHDLLVTAVDSGGASGTTRTLRLIVEPVNDAPTAQVPGRLSVDEDASTTGLPGEHVLTGFATAIGVGNVYEASDGQALLGFSVTGAGTLFAIAPTLALDGTLRFTLAPDAHGEARLGLRLADDGPGAPPHANALELDVTLEVRPVNDAPVVVPDGPLAILPGVPGQALDVLANDHDPEGDTLRLLDWSMDPLFGTLRLEGTRLRYDPAPGFEDQVATFTYRAFDGALASAPALVTLNVFRPDPAVAYVEWFPSHVCVDTPITLQGVAVFRLHRAIRWEWDLGDGTTAVRDNTAHYDRIVHAYALGWHTATVRATLIHDADPGEQVVFTASADLRAVRCVVPVPMFTYDLRRLEAAFQDQSVDPDGAVVAWFWDFGDGTTSTARHPVHVFAAFRTYVVRLTVMDDEGNFAFIERTLSVEDRLDREDGTEDDPMSGGRRGASEWEPHGLTADGRDNGVPAARIQPPPRVRPGASMVLDASASFDPDGDALTFRWSQTDGPPVVLLGDDGPHPGFRVPAQTVVLRLVVSDGKASAPADVLIDPAEPLAATFAVERAGKGHRFVPALMGASPDARVEWDLGAGLSSNEWSPQHTFPAGTHTVTLRVLDGDVVEAVQAFVVESGSQPPVRPGLDGVAAPASAPPLVAWLAGSGVAVLALAALVALAAARKARARRVA